MAESFEDVRKRSFDVLEKIQSKFRSDWLYDDQGPSHEQVESLKEAGRHVAAAKAALARAALAPARTEGHAAARRSGFGRKD